MAKSVKYVKHTLSKVIHNPYPSASSPVVVSGYAYQHTGDYQELVDIIFLQNHHLNIFPYSLAFFHFLLAPTLSVSF